MEAWERRFNEEFNLAEVHSKTPKYHIPVRFPCWLADKDKPDVLLGIDRYWELMMDHYPWAAAHFPVSEYTVWIHNARGAFVAGNEKRQIWAHGWCRGKFLIVAWSWDYDDQGRPFRLASKNFLDPLPHEWFHAIFDIQKTWADPGHKYFADVAAIMMMIALESPTVELSQDSIMAARYYSYVPWCIAGGRYPEDE
jgi:hypothetical protein